MHLMHALKMSLMKIESSGVIINLIWRMLNNFVLMIIVILAVLL